MFQGCSSVPSDLMDSICGPMDQLMQFLESIRSPSQIPQFNAPTLNGEGEVELFIEQFMDIAVVNSWSDKSTQFRLEKSLEGPARSYGRGNSVDTIFNNIETRYGTSAQGDKEWLLGLTRDSKGSVFTLPLR